jgi:DNA invertase Pin-like site-specific DNA recombinase
MQNETYLNKYDARNVSKSRKAPEGKRRVAIDVRVSTEHEKQINALDNQRQWAMELAADHKDWIFHPDTDLYVEEGLSGTSTEKRPQFLKMIERAKKGRYNLIVVREVCRFMRNAKITLVLVDELLKYGVEVYFVNDGIKTRNKDDYFKLTIMAQYAEQESRKISERVFSGQAIARENGVIFGNGNILGYKQIKGKKSCDTVYVIDEEQAKTVRKIYELSLKGFGIKKIRRYLVENGYLTAEGNEKWYDSTIERILRRSTYMGEITHLQTVTEDPLTHKRVPVEKDKQVRVASGIPPIIEPEMWHKVQAAIDSRTGSYSKKDNQGMELRGRKENKDVYCRKLRCGCGRRFQKNHEYKNDTSTYRCYALVEDGSRKKRKENSEILGDNCCIGGIRDWKLDLFTLKVFSYLECNVDAVKERLLSIIEKSFVNNEGVSDSSEKKMKLEKDIQKLREKNERLLDGYENCVLDKETYHARKAKNDQEMERKLALKANMDQVQNMEEQRTETLRAVRKFLKEALAFPTVGSEKIKVPETLVDTYVNSIKACADNVYEYNIRVNPNVPVQIPVIPDDEFNPQIHSAYRTIDNSNATLLAEFCVDYDEAKEYAGSRSRKVVRAHFDKPATIRIYANL